MEVELKCETCKCAFIRGKAEADRNAKKGMRTFCSRKCRGKKILDDTPIDRRMSTKNLPKKELDKYSPFRPHLKSIKNHAKKIGKKVYLTLEDLKTKWENQKGICLISGRKMENYRSSRDYPCRSPFRASVDRIDSTGDYAIENVRFVSMMAQFAKNNFTDEDLFSFCKDVVAHQQAQNDFFSIPLLQKPKFRCMMFKSRRQAGRLPLLHKIF